MDFETVDPADFGTSLTGIGINLLVRDVQAETRFLTQVFQMQGHRISADFAIMQHQSQLLQLHSDGTYFSHPLLDLLPENPPRGAGCEIRLYQCDPDQAADKAEHAGGMVLQPPTDKPHGLRECYILCPDGYAWMPSLAIKS